MAGSSAAMAKKKSIFILDLRRVNNIGIGLSRFYKRLSVEEIIEAIVNRQTTKLSLDDMLTLKSLLPSDEERKSISLYRGPIEDLGHAERFALLASEEPYLDWMLNSLIFERNFDGECESLSNKLKSIIRLLNLVREVPLLKVLLKAVLELGNLANYDYGNVPTHLRLQGRAQGFRFESLTKLQDVKSIDKKTNLLSYLVMTLAEKQPEVLNLSNEFSDLGIAKHWDTDAILNQLQELAVQFKRIFEFEAKDERGKLALFKAEQQVFIGRALIKISEVTSLGQILKDTWSKTCQYIGEDRSERRPENLFSTLDHFFRSFTNELQALKIRPSHLKESDAPSGDLHSFLNKEPRPTGLDSSTSSEAGSTVTCLTRSSSPLSIKSSNQALPKM